MDETSQLVGSGDVHEYVVQDGDMARASGLVVAVSGEPVRFCAPAAVATGFGSFTACPGPSIVAVGVDTTDLVDRETQDGAVRGYAELTGIYRDGTLSVTDQRADREVRSMPDQTPPCPSPVDGWPRRTGEQPRMDAVVAYARSHPGAIVEQAYLNPAPDQTLVYVLTTDDPATVTAATAALAPTYGDGLCVTTSRYTSAQLTHARSMTCDLMRSQGAGSLTAPTVACGVGLAPDLQVATFTDVPAVTAETAAIFDDLPAGLVQVAIWLKPVP